MYPVGFDKRIDEVVEKIGGIGKASSAIGVSYPTISRWKDGLSDAKLSNIIALADVAGVSLDWLIYGKGEQKINRPVTQSEPAISVEQAIDTLKNIIDNQPKLTDDEDFLLKKFRALDSDKQRLMLSFLIGGFDNLSNNSNNGSNNKGVFNSPSTNVTGSFTG